MFLQCKMITLEHCSYNNHNVLVINCLMFTLLQTTPTCAAVIHLELRAMIGGDLEG